jgi:dTDP-4-dehydrorhamnose reductase
MAFIHFMTMAELLIPHRTQQTHKPKLLITGASGFLGWYLCQAALPDWQVLGTYCTKACQLTGVELIRLDLCEPSQVQELFTTWQPNAVIHAAAQSQPNFCQLNPEVSQAVNVTASLTLANLCAETGIPLLFTSTDLVFDGQNAPYLESAPVSPLSLYGEQKVAAEVGILTRHPTATICRMPLMFGAAPTAVSFLQPFLKTLRAGEPLSLFEDEYRTPVSGATAAAGLLLMLKQHVQGIIHLGGSERLSRYQFGQILVEILQLPAAQLKACRQADVPMAAPRPADVCLDSGLAWSLGYQPQGIREQLLAVLG